MKRRAKPVEKATRKVSKNGAVARGQDSAEANVRKVSKNGAVARGQNSAEANVRKASKRGAVARGQNSAEAEVRKVSKRSAVARGQNSAEANVRKVSKSREGARGQNSAEAEVRKASKRDVGARGQSSAEANVRTLSKRAGARAGEPEASLYLFAIVDARPAASIRGVDFVRAAGAWIAVARMTVPELTVEAAIEHDRVVRAVAAKARAVLPLRFGMSAPNAHALVEKLAPFRTVIRAGLARVRGAVQLTMRVGGREMPVRPARGDGPGTRFLKTRLAAERVPEIAPLSEALSPYVRDTRIERLGHGENFASVFFLVDRVHLAKWRRVVRATTLEHVTVQVTGPWPPYAFAELR